MASPVDTPTRPSLHPLWAPQYNLGGFPRSSNRSAPASYYSSSERSPKSLPTPVFPSNDGSMRQHERAMVDLLGQKLRQSNELSPPKSRPRPLSPLSETFSVADGRRFSAAAISPRRPIPPQPATPLSPPAVAAGRRQTLAAENRCMLLAGLGEEAKRRQSVPNAGYLASPRDTKRHQLEQLRAWGHVYLGDAKSCDVFVQAMALRRPSDASSTSDNSAGDSSPTRIPTTPSLPAHQTAMRARVRPHNVRRKAFLVHRTFDIEQLRSTVPDPLPSTPPADVRRRPSLAGSSLPKVGSPRPSAPRRMSSSSGHSPLPYNRGLRSVQSRGPSRGATTMPIHLSYVRFALPVLAAFIVSGHINTGDVIDLPMPHPEAWASTVAYVYTGQGDVTDAVRENILYLAGKA